MIWYLDHSAIAVETNNHLLLFDLFGKTLQPPKEMGLAQGFVNPDELRDKDVVIFVSHEHPDHFDPAIFSLRDRLKRVRFVLPEEFDEIYQGDLFAAPASRWTRVYTATACADCWRLTAGCLQKTSFPSTSGEIFR